MILNTTINPAIAGTLIKKDTKTMNTNINDNRAKINDARIKREKRIVKELIKYLNANGWKIYAVYDGEEFYKVKTTTEAMKIIFNLDEVSIRVKKETKSHGIFLVPGNDIDIISDWTFSDGDYTGFNALMESFDTEKYNNK
jgi:hypothetical protein